MALSTETRVRLRIREVAQAHGVKNPQRLHYLTGISYTSITKLWHDSDTLDPRLSTLLRVAAALKVSVCDLLVMEAIDRRHEQAS